MFKQGTLCDKGTPVQFNEGRLCPLGTEGTRWASPEGEKRCRVRSSAWGSRRHREEFGWGSVEGFAEEPAFALDSKKAHDFPYMEILRGKGIWARAWEGHVDKGAKVRKGSGLLGSTADPRSQDGLGGLQWRWRNGHRVGWGGMAWGGVGRRFYQKERLEPGVGVEELWMPCNLKDCGLGRFKHQASTADLHCLAWWLWLGQNWKVENLWFSGNLCVAWGLQVCATPGLHWGNLTGSPGHCHLCWGPEPPLRDHGRKDQKEGEKNPQEDLDTRKCSWKQGLSSRTG